MPPISLGDVSSFVRTTDPNDFGLHFNIVEANGCTKAGALIINTFDDLEADVLAALRAEYPRIYTYTNCKYACEVWGVGLRVDEEVRREQVASHVRHAMKAEEMRGSAARWKSKAEEAVAPGGLSCENLQSMVRALGCASAEAQGV
ncbi:unnamed protein product [Triticum turgidum subsp. durum]|uniref:Uncharacterized protein n=1 Tax=Triticum turgidum subsp. durum TaxID=4567 RepID=A0A9R1A384_TRITD|nr:unnamed protein product [Triticum turgidum subsp. durum]